MKIDISEKSVWYHGSNKMLDILRPGSTITTWRYLAEAFSHKPTLLSYDDDGKIMHNCRQKGYLYVIDESVDIKKDIYEHPSSTMDKNAEFLTKRPLKLKLIAEL